MMQQSALLAERDGCGFDHHQVGMLQNTSCDDFIIAPFLSEIDMEPEQARSAPLGGDL